MVVGKLNKGDRCRSSLECAGSLRCQGSGPTDVGTCASARPTGPCSTAVDALAGVLRLDVILQPSLPI